MGRNYGLTNTEMQIMEYLWSQKEKVSFRQICDYFNDVQGKNWRKQTLNTYLSNLKRAGMVGVDQSGTRYTYYPICSKEELVHKWTKNVIEESFDGSLGNLIAAFTSGEQLSEKELEDIKKVIDSY